MRAMPLVSLILCGCMRVGSDPWMAVNYTEGECGTKRAILTTTGCVTEPTSHYANGTSMPVNSPNDVSGHAHAAPSETHKGK